MQETISDPSAMKPHAKANKAPSTTFSCARPRLNSGLVGNRCHSLGLVVLDRNGPRLPWLGGESLELHGLALGLGLLLQFGILLYPAQETLS